VKEWLSEVRALGPLFMQNEEDNTVSEISGCRYGSGENPLETLEKARQGAIKLFQSGINLNSRETTGG